MSSIVTGALLTNRLILQPLVELSFNAKDDPLRGTGSGLSKAEAGLRLRYEIKRQFAPYVGVVHERVFGGTADYHRDEAEAVRDIRFVVGVRVWF
jgi:copper resistance protein B